jgi:PRC-barrel domain protein
MADAYRAASIERGGGSWSEAGGQPHSYQAEDIGGAGFGRRSSEHRSRGRWRGYSDDRAPTVRADDFIPLFGMLAGGAIGYVLAVMASGERSHAHERSSGTSSMQGLGTGGMSSSESLETDETTDLIASNKVEGTAVYNRAGERLGDVYNFMVGKRSGRVAYAVMSFGGFLGIGQRYHALPWHVLTYDTSRGGYVIDATKDRLLSAPSYQISEDPLTRPDHLRQVRDYWATGQLSM